MRLRHTILAKLQVQHWLWKYKIQKIICRLLGHHWSIKICYRCGAPKYMPLKDADFTLVKLAKDRSDRFTPHCKLHGAMNKFTDSGIWRCCSVYGFKPRGKGQYPELKDNDCRAGCQEAQQ